MGIPNVCEQKAVDEACDEPHARANARKSKLSQMSFGAKPQSKSATTSGVATANLPKKNSRRGSE
jgi:hypothetical protein